MASFSVFFDGPLGFGIQPVDPIDADHAVEITLGIHGGSRFSAVPSEELEGCDKHKLLRAWNHGEGGQMHQHKLIQVRSAPSKDAGYCI